MVLVYVEELLNMILLLIILRYNKGDGWIGGMSATVGLPHKWYNVSYGMQLSENTFR